MNEPAIVSTAAAVISAVAVAVLVAAVIRRRRFTLADAGVLLVLVAIPVASVQPSDVAWDGVLNATGYALVFASYPGGRVVPRWLWIPVVSVVAGAAGLAVVGTAALDESWYLILVPFAMTVLIIGTVVRYLRRLSTSEREGVRWAVLGAIVTFGGMSVVVAATALSSTTIANSGPWVDALVTTLVIASPVALAVGIAAPRLAPVDVVLFEVVRVIVVAVPTVILVGLVVGWLPQHPWPAAIAAGVVAVPLWFVGGRIAAWFVYHGRMSPAVAVRALDSVLGAADDPTDAPQVIAEVVARALGSARTIVSGPGLRSGTSGEAVSSDARAPDEVVAVPYAGVEIARITVSARTGETGLTRTDRRVLDQLAQRAAASLHAARTVNDLVDARAALVCAHEEERKRLRRDLHDELAPTLVGLRLTASGVVRLLEASNGALAGTARTMVADVEAAIDQTRALAHGLRPPVLDADGLVAAIRARARSTDGLRVSVAAPTAQLDLPAAVEVAALRIVQEAVTNARKHSGARNCEVLVTIDDHTLLVHVDDDGHGITHTARPGLGLASMRDRVNDLGGRFDLETSPLGGLRVAAALPVGAT
ncbi:signal transduction histidine kinase [Microbacterium terrae]|uniref:Sensor histidine kinase ComP n=1 Tax=Microbacterium terrae TaxID=69369 RepID=A0A0M2H352_9MICO|nr:sensor histidine kinase [Microbacterium terrae]KJL38728.1 Sensor histidine kinase ComP [Microbacterium terrae]MBP1076147.1 signal transduction histidine kinase [Microbacterium terrae]GLJ96967.1 hypothetical protein GCM10017594_01640 [Microbacterium terrae]